MTQDAHRAQTTVRFGPWTIGALPEATRQAFAQVETGGPDACECHSCRNWVAVRQHAYPGAYLDFLTRLGATAHLEEEVVHYGRVPEGHSYGGWAYVAGELLDGPDSRVAMTSGTGFEIRLEPLQGTFSVGVSKHTATAPRDSFKGLPLLMIEFSVIAPWVIAAPEPD